MALLSGKRGGKRFLAVDFDSRHLRLAEAECVGEKARILRLIDLPMPEDVDFTDADSLGRFLGTQLRELKLRGVGVLMNVPRGQAVLKPLSLPPGTPEEEMPGMVQFQMEKELPFPMAEAVIDFTVERHFDAETGKAESAGEDVLVAAVRLSTLDFYRNIAEAANVKLLRLGLRPYANHHCAEACLGDGEAERMAVVCVNADETEIDVIQGGSLAFSRSAMLKIPADPDRARSRLQSVSLEVARSLQSFQAVDRESNITAIHVAGGTGLEPALARDLSTRLRTRCETFDPAEALQLRQQGDASAFVSVIGLAIGHAARQQMPFDFLNPKKPAVKKDRTAMQGVLLVVFLLCLLVGGMAMGFVVVGRRQQEVRRLQAIRNQKLKQAKQADATVDRFEAVEQWQESGRDWLSHLAHLSHLLPEASDVFIDKFSTHNSQRGAQMKFRVHARSSETIDDLSRRLGAAGYRVKTEGSDRTDRPTYGYDWHDDFTVLVPEDMDVEWDKMSPASRPAGEVADPAGYRRSQPRRSRRSRR
ncbi:MAG: pilus assembly protein PilM [Phycisphaerae bacterium]